MEIKVKSYSTQSSLISSILFLILGGIICAFAEEIETTIFFCIGLFLAFIALISIIMYIVSVKREQSEVANLAFGIVLSIFAGIFIFSPGIIHTIIKYLIGGWIFFNGIMRLITALSYNHKNTKFIPMLVVSILLIIIGLFTILMNFGEELRIVGIIIIAYSLIDIMGYIFYSKDKREMEEEGTASIIVNKVEKEKSGSKRKNKKIKDVEESTSDSEEEKED